MARLRDLPHDIHLAIFSLLSVADALKLLRALCLRELYASRHLWCALLERERRVRPLPCPEHVNVWDLDLSSAQIMARKLSDISSNMSRPEPRLGHNRGDTSPEFVHLGFTATIMHAIPGTRVVILHSPLNGGYLWYYDIDTGTCRRCVQVGDHIDYTAFEETKNQLVFAAAMKRKPREISDDLRTVVHVVEINYEDRAAPQITSYVQRFRMWSWGIFLFSSEFIGSLCIMKAGTDGLILALEFMCLRDTKRCTQVFVSDWTRVTDVVHLSKMPPTAYVYQDDVYVVQGDLQRISVRRVPHFCLDRVKALLMGRSDAPGRPYYKLKLKEEDTLFHCFDRRPCPGGRVVETQRIVPVYPAYGLQFVSVHECVRDPRSVLSYSDEQAPRLAEWNGALRFSGSLTFWLASPPESDSSSCSSDSTTASFSREVSLVQPNPQPSLESTPRVPSTSTTVELEDSFLSTLAQDLLYISRSGAYCLYIAKNQKLQGKTLITVLHHDVCAGSTSHHTLTLAISRHNVYSFVFDENNALLLVTTKDSQLHKYSLGGCHRED